MADSDRRDFQGENILSKICNYILESADLELLRRLFLPSIDRRVHALLEHFVYRDHEDTPKRLLDGVDAWLEASERLFRLDGLAGVFVDSILMSNRLDSIGREIDRVAFKRPELGIDLTKGYVRLEYWIARCQSTFLKRTPPEATTTVSTTPTRQCSRKRKAGNYHEKVPESRSANPFDACPSSVGDQTKSQSRTSTKLRDRQASAASGSDKLKVVVTEVCPDGGTRRSEYLKLPCDSKALREKVFGKGLMKCDGKLDERLRSVCVCLNNVMRRMPVNDATLSCDIRQNYVRFKLGRLKSKLCMFASRVALGRLRERNSNCDKKADIRACKEENDESLSSRENDQSAKYLWCRNSEEFSASSFEGDESFEEDSSSTGVEKKEGNSVGTKSKATAANCPCNNENTLQELGLDCDKVGSLKVKEKNERYPVQRDSKDAAVMTEEGCCVKRAPKNVETCTDDIDDTVELTNVYINEISLCYCNDKEDVGVNTENTCLATFANVATNTDCTRFREISTQVFFKEIHFCACDKKVDEEFEIKNIKFADRDVDYSCKCNKETSTDDKYTLIELEIAKDCEKSLDSSGKKSECTLAMKAKINEIVDLNEKIREKFQVLKGRKDLCSVSVQTLSKRSCSSRNIQVQVRTSVTSLKSNVGKCTNKPVPVKSLERKESTTQFVRVCNNSICQYKKEESTLRRSILTEVAASLQDPALQKLRRNSIICEAINESSENSSRCLSRLAQGDTFYLDHSRSFVSRKLRRTCRCSKKNHFLNFLSEHLTRETFERCKSLVRTVLRKLLDKVKALNELRKPTCRQCCSASTYHHEPPGKTTCGTRLAAGASNHVSSKESSRANEFTRACRDFENRFVGRRRRGRSSEWVHVSSERCRRIEAFASDWR